MIDVSFVIGAVFVLSVIAWVMHIKPRKDQKGYERELRSGKSREYLEKQVRDLITEKSKVTDDLSNMQNALLECCQLLDVTKSDWVHEDTLLNFPNVLREYIQKNNHLQGENRRQKEMKAEE